MKPTKHFTLNFFTFVFLSILTVNNIIAQEKNILLYYNSFENPIDSLGWNGDLIFNSDVPHNGGKKSIFVSGGCIVPHVWVEFGPFGKNELLIIRCWGKNLEVGGNVSLNVSGDRSNSILINIENKEWTFYESSDTLLCPAGSTVSLSISSGGYIPSSMLIDCVEIVKIIKDKEVHRISNDAIELTLRNQSSIFLDSLHALKVDTILNHIKKEIDTLKNIHVFPNYYHSGMSLKTNAEWSNKWYEGSLLTGELYIDSLNMKYNLISVDTPRFSNFKWFSLIFNQPLKISSIAEKYRNHDGVEYAEPQGYIGDGDNIEFINKDSLWHFVFSIGRGDCPAGCIYRYYWYVTVKINDGNNKVILDEESPRNMETPKFFRWNIPPRYAMTMFDNVNAIFDSIKYSSKWWIRKHAIEGIKLFWKHDFPWVGEDINDHWYELRNKVLSSRQEIINLLSLTKNDPDEDVKISAETLLNELLVSDLQTQEDTIYNGFHLFQNYPNPFNPITNIKYIVPYAGRKNFSIYNVTLKIFDLLGKEITVLVSEPQSPGIYTISFNGSKLSSGVYIYKLQIGNYSAVKKLMLIK